jgi:hypothetical protein
LVNLLTTIYDVYGLDAGSVDADYDFVDVKD